MPHIIPSRTLRLTLRWIVDETCGIKVPAETLEQLARDVAGAIRCELFASILRSIDRLMPISASACPPGSNDSALTTKSVRPTRRQVGGIAALTGVSQFPIVRRGSVDHNRLTIQSFWASINPTGGFHLGNSRLYIFEVGGVTDSRGHGRPKGRVPRAIAAYTI